MSKNGVCIFQTVEQKNTWWPILSAEYESFAILELLKDRGENYHKTRDDRRQTSLRKNTRLAKIYAKIAGCQIATINGQDYFSYPEVVVGTWSARKKLSFVKKSQRRHPKAVTA